MPELDVTAAAGLIEAITAVAVRAALVIRAVGARAGVERKTDGSPVTEADLASETAICEALSLLAPLLPIVSEEQAQAPVMGSPAGSYFLVDPLDGTREFIAGRDEYTVNIAAMTNGSPVLGVIAAPALGLIWRGVVGRGAEGLRFTGEGKTLAAASIHVRPRPIEPVVLVSRSHLDARTQAYLQSLPQARAMACGSALKFCRIAEGSADLYPRLSPTCDWDTAAGHAIVVAAGGRVASPGGAPLCYGTKELIIPGFIAAGDGQALA